MIDPRTTSLETLLTDLQMKYRESFDGVSVQQYLYSKVSKLALVNNFREKAFELLSDYSPEIVKEGHLCHLKDFLQ